MKCLHMKVLMSINQIVGVSYTGNYTLNSQYLHLLAHIYLLVFSLLVDAPDIRQLKAKRNIIPRMNERAR